MSMKSLIRRVLSMFSCSKKHARRSGVIKFFDRKKRFGFIVSDQNEYFFHAAATSPMDFKALKDGVAVTFIVVQGKKGQQADNIEIV